MSSEFVSSPPEYDDYPYRIVTPCGFLEPPTLNNVLDHYAFAIDNSDLESEYRITVHEMQVALHLQTPADWQAVKDQLLSKKPEPRKTAILVQTSRAHTTPNLRLVSSFNHEAYPVPLNMIVGFDPNERSSDHAFRYHPTYKAFKRDTRLDKVERDLRTFLPVAGVHDYHLFREGNILRAHFKNEKDRFVATAIANPELQYSVKLIQFEKREPPRRIKKKAIKLAKEFSRAAIEGRIVFDIHLSNKAITVTTDSGYGFAQLFGHIRRFGKQIDQNLVVL